MKETHRNLDTGTGSTPEVRFCRHCRALLVPPTLKTLFHTFRIEIQLIFHPERTTIAGQFTEGEKKGSASSLRVRRMLGAFDCLRNPQCCLRRSDNVPVKMRGALDVYEKSCSWTVSKRSNLSSVFPASTENSILPDSAHITDAYVCG